MKVCQKKKKKNQNNFPFVRGVGADGNQLNLIIKTQ